MRVRKLFFLNNIQQLHPHSTENVEKTEKLSVQTKPWVSFELSLSENAKFKPKPCVTTATEKGLFTEQKQNSFKHHGTVHEAGGESFLSP